MQWKLRRPDPAKLPAWKRLPLLDALSSMLIEGRLDYGFRLSNPVVRFDQALERAAEARQHHSMKRHVCDLRGW